MKDVITDNPEILDVNKVFLKGLDELKEKGWAQLNITLTAQNYRITKIEKSIKESHICDKSTGRFLLDNPSHANK